MENSENNIKQQMTLYLFFAFLMIILNYLIQKLNQVLIAPWICTSLGGIDFFHTFYCAITPYNMRELVGSIAAVGITYIIKYFLDKFIVFQKKQLKMKETSIEFLKYFGFAILTTALNIGIQFLLTNFFSTPLELSMAVALSIGYLTKFFLDRKYVFIQ
ncbi:MAG: GtrA-like protein [Promethearchaeota archaeon]|jgi:putative flippase GtrA|nr:MAG: GtrA-like protein [Candidatus Lokiarchaeota archaeon]